MFSRKMIHIRLVVVLVKVWWGFISYCFGYRQGSFRTEKEIISGKFFRRTKLYEYEEEQELLNVIMTLSLFLKSARLFCMKA